MAEATCELGVQILVIWSTIEGGKLLTLANLRCHGLDVCLSSAMLSGLNVVILHVS